MGALAVVNGGTFINGLDDDIHNISEELLSDEHVNNGSGTLNGVPLEDVMIVAKDDDSGVGLLEVGAVP